MLLDQTSLTACRLSDIHSEVKGIPIIRDENQIAYIFGPRRILPFPDALKPENINLRFNKHQDLNDLLVCRDNASF